MSTFIPFDQWLKDNPDLVQHVKEEAKDCCGEYCQTCGEKFTCEQCNEAAQRKQLRHLYAATKDEQRKKLKAWTAAIRSLSDAKRVNEGAKKEDRAAMRKR